MSNTSCLFNEWDSTKYKGGPDCTIVAAMQSARTFDNYLNIYCVNPPSDSCQIGYCPQPDVAGTLIRISAYLTTLCLAILMFYSDDHEEVKNAYWTQNLTMYSILIAAVISVIRNDLTKYHAVMAIQIVGSPLMFYMVIYAVRSLMGHRHRMDKLMQTRKRAYCAFAIGTLVIWVACVIFTLATVNHDKFSQPECKSEAKRMFFQILFMLRGIKKEPAAGAAFIITTVLTIVAFFVAIWIRRHELWYHTGTRKTPSVVFVWETIGKHYSFIHFFLVFVYPFTAWVCTIEVDTLMPQSNDHNWDASFGQILPLVITIQPIISVCKLAPQFGAWFWDLAWMRLITGRAQRYSKKPTLPEFVALDDDIAEGDEKDDLKVLLLPSRTFESTTSSKSSRGGMKGMGWGWKDIKL